MDMSSIRNALRQTVFATVFAFSTAIGFHSGAEAQQHQAVPAPAATTLPAETATELRPALWLVRDADTTIYLFGTVHLLQPGLNWLNGPVAQALAQSDTLVTEVVKTEDEDLALQAAVLDLAMLPPRQSLREMMKPDARKAFEALLSREGMPADAFDRYEPWYPAIVLSMLPLIKQGMLPDSGVEAKLSEVHGARTREGLETSRFQIELFDTLSAAAQYDYLASVVAHYDEIGPKMDGLVTAWGKGDDQAIGAAMLDNNDIPEVADVLVRRRNETWASWISNRMEHPGTVFIAVGAGHLAGADSVQHFLEADKLKVERVQ